jgi:hypothetical protein
MREDAWPISGHKLSFVCVLLSYLQLPSHTHMSMPACLAPADDNENMLREKSRKNRSLLTACVRFGLMIFQRCQSLVVFGGKTIFGIFPSYRYV